ncbi:Flavodoxin [Marinospirillum celere]|uniref:Flavodoxin n=1 Tax=Marinospirillum celere TaxID=1122252 RepID=A0A1I1GLW3_9GAMM|nr:flavodoxin domain-containing protein [Marinospirillum celere]SFC12242.1 Flavodoxin [Marinospirillum celere]
MAAIQILVGSVYGGALEVAEGAAQAASNAGHQVNLTEMPNSNQLLQADQLLLVTSTTGSGELPESLLPLYEELSKQPPNLAGLPYAVIALGDSSYGDSFCAAGKLMDATFADLGAKRSLPLLELDALEFFDASEGADEWISAWVQKVSETG